VALCLEFVHYDYGAAQQAENALQCVVVLSEEALEDFNSHCNTSLCTLQQVRDLASAEEALKASKDDRSVVWRDLQSLQVAYVW